MTAILEIKGLNKYFGEQQILDEFDLFIEHPKVIALVAPNGTGKTTLLNIIANIESPDSGTVTVFGKTNKNHTVFKKMAYLQDNSILYSQLNGWDHLNFVAKEHGISQTETMELATELGMESYLKKRVKHYSLGMKQHLLLALALISKPQLLLMDEPLNGLDPSSIIQVREIIQRLYLQGVTMIISSHNLHEIEKLTDDVFFLYQGQLLSKEQLVPDHYEYQVILSGTEKALAYFKDLGLPCQPLSAYKLQLVLTKKELADFHIFCAENQLQLFDQQVANNDLEAVYFDLFSKQQTSGESVQ